MSELDKIVDENIEEKDNKKPNKRILGIIIAVVAAVATGLFIWHCSKFQSTDDAYVESHIVPIAAKVSGQIVDVFIDDNQRIKEGDVIAIIDDADYKIKFNQADAQYQKALLAQNIAKANKNAVDSEVEFAKIDLERYKKLYETGAVSKQTLDTAQTKFDNIIAKNTTADQAIFATSSQKTKVADADLKSLKALKDQAELNLSYTKIKALRGGVVTNKRVEKGAYVQVGAPLCNVVPDEVWVVANFKENQVGKMRPGQPVDIKIDAYPNKVFKGKIDSIQRASGAKSSLFPPENAVGSFVKIVQRIPVKIVFTEPIDSSKYNIVAGMSVVPKVRVKEDNK